MTALATTTSSATIGGWHDRYVPSTLTPCTPPTETGTVKESGGPRMLYLDVMAGGRLRIEIDDDPPGWLWRLIQRTKDLLDLEPGWNSHAAAAVPGMSARTFLMMASNAFDEHTPAPTVTPVSDGGIQMEWHEVDMEIEVEIDATGVAHVWYIDSLTQDSDEFSEREEFPRFTQLISDLSRRA